MLSVCPLWQSQTQWPPGWRQNKKKGFMLFLSISLYTVGHCGLWLTHTLVAGVQLWKAVLTYCPEMWGRARKDVKAIKNFHKASTQTHWRGWVGIADPWPPAIGQSLPPSPWWVEEKTDDRARRLAARKTRRDKQDEVGEELVRRRKQICR